MSMLGKEVLHCLFCTKTLNRSVFSPQLDYDGYTQLVIVSLRLNGCTCTLETSGCALNRHIVSSVKCLYELDCEFDYFFVCFCTHREMDRLGIITPSHQDIITASLQQEMLSQMQHMQHTMVPVWVGKRMETCSEKSFHLPHLCTLEGLSDHMSERKAALLPTSILWNFLKKETKKEGKTKTVDTDTDSSKLLWAPAQAPSS